MLHMHFPISLAHKPKAKDLLFGLMSDPCTKYYKGQSSKEKNSNDVLFQNGHIHYTSVLPVVPQDHTLVAIYQYGNE